MNVSAKQRESLASETTFLFGHFKSPMENGKRFCHGKRLARISKLGLRYE